MKRWIIRSCFIGLLLLFVGGWGVSYKYQWGLCCKGHYFWTMECNRGTIYLWKISNWNINWFDWNKVIPKRWSYVVASASTDFDSMFVEFGRIGEFNGDGYRHEFFGFIVEVWDELGVKMVALPFYFLTTISAALLWLVWRKTRPKVKGRTFPVEVEKQESTP